MIVFSVGGVINRGDKILDIVPEADSLVIEAQLAIEDIIEVRPKMHADIHLTAYKQRITAVVHGEVLHVSADRLIDNRTGNGYYVVLVRMNEDDLAEIPNMQLSPGMSATVMIPTVERSALDYLISPIAASFDKAFRQR